MQSITEGTKSADFTYNADNQRIRMVVKEYGTATKTRWYFGGSCEREQVGSTVNQYIWIGGDAYSAVAVAKKVNTGSFTVYNIFRDHLGTITQLRNSSTGQIETDKPRPALKQKLPFGSAGLKIGLLINLLIIHRIQRLVLFLG